MNSKYSSILLVLLAVGIIKLYAVPQWENSDRSNIIDENIDIYQYLPFENNSKIIRLNEDSTLKLENNLPNLDGATALYPIYSAFANAVFPRLELNQPTNPLNNTYTFVPGQIACSKTPEAYNRLINGEADIIFCAAPSDEQINMAQEKGVTLNLTPIGKEAFVFFVNRNNPITNLTYSQIRDIYSGRVTNWRNLGGNDSAILAYQRPKNSGSQTILESIMSGDIIMEPLKENMIQEMGPIIEEVASFRNSQNSIGYSFLFYSTEMARNDNIKLLSIDGIIPSANTIRSGDYPFTQIFYAITVGQETENTRRFIEWILSDQGQYIIEKTGYVPIR
jgi:phosphate transport system substrate-binding protein